MELNKRKGHFFFFFPRALSIWSLIEFGSISYTQQEQLYVQWNKGRQTLPDTGELPLEVAGGETSFDGDGVRDRAGVGLGSRKKLKS